jgi:LysM repeat protein
MDLIEIKSAKLAPANLGERAGAQIESQLNARADIGKAHKFFGPGAESHAAASLPTVPGSESAALAAIPGAKDPISPLVQMIMRLPGHIGLLNSFFEALQAFFLPHTDLLAGFDPSVLGAHGAESSLTGGIEHGTIDPSILPPEAHIFEGLDKGLISELSIKTTWNMNLHNSSSDLFHHSLNVSATPDVSNAVYEKSTSHLNGIEKSGVDEQAGGVLAGPSISQTAAGSHLAGSHPIFSKDLFDKAGVQSNGAMLASAPQNTAHTAVAQNLGNTSAMSVQHLSPPATNASYVSGSPLNTTPALSELGTNAINAGATNASFSFVPRNGLELGSQSLAGQPSFGPSGAVSDNLAVRNLLGSNDELASNFHPSTLNSAGSTDISSQQSLSTQFKDGQSTSAHSQAPLKGLRAKELSLDGSKLAKLSNNHHSATTHSHKTDPLASHSGSKAGIADSHKSPTIKSHSSASPNQNAKTSAVDSEREQVAMATPATTPEQTSLETGTHTVHSGDSLWKVAQENLGDANRWPDIYKLNIDKIGANPDLIHPGLKLDLPEHAQDIANPTQASSEYVVKAGDNLWDISKHFYGSGTHWSEIYHSNADVIGSDPRLIFPGEKLSIQSTDASTTVANAAGSASPNPVDAGTTGHTAQLANAAPVDSTSPVAQTAGHAASHASKSVAQVASNSDGTSQPAFSGPGAADAKVANEFKTTTGDASIVSPSLAPDLSFLSRKR